MGLPPDYYHLGVIEYCQKTAENATKHGVAENNDNEMNGVMWLKILGNGILGLNERSMSMVARGRAY